jgi:ABC-type transport system involved in multi-copper enzyme maturation permease subunit
MTRESTSNANRLRRQLLSVARFEVRKIFAGRRWIAGVVAAYLPLLPMLLAILDGDMAESNVQVGEVSLVFAGIFQSYILRLAIFFIAVDTFSRLYRGEIMEKTLHYYLLAPVRREVILLGKYLAGLLQMAVIFVPATIAAYVMLFVMAGPRVLEANFINGNGISHAISYGAITLLGCVGYGAVFMLLGLVAKNPTIPALMVLGWESVNIFLPAIFQKFSIIYYLQSICPVPLPFGPLEVITEPTSPWISVPGMLVMTALILLGAAFLMRRSEVSYTND